MGNIVTPQDNGKVDRRPSLKLPTCSATNGHGLGIKGVELFIQLMEGYTSVFADSDIVSTLEGWEETPLGVRPNRPPTAGGISNERHG